MYFRVCDFRVALILRMKLGSVRIFARATLGPAIASPGQRVTLGWFTTNTESQKTCSAEGRAVGCVEKHFRLRKGALQYKSPNES
jgi:hypothetical protein